MVLATRPAGAFPAALPSTPLLGEIVTWTCSGVTVRHTDLVAALREAGLDEAVARELAPRHAFTRACKKLSDQRIIRPVSEDADIKSGSLSYAIVSGRLIVILAPALRRSSTRARRAR